MSTLSIIINKAFGPIKWIKSKYEQSIINKMQLREKRLPIYQEAHRRVNEMLRVANIREEKTGFLIECWQWYNNNCLYLDSEVRESVRKALNAATVHDSLPPEHMRENWKYIQDAKEAIEKAVDQIKT